MNTANGPPKIRAERNAKEITLADAAKILQSEDRETLVGLLLDCARSNDWLRDRLILYAARRAGPGSGAAAARRAFENAVRVRGFVDYRQAAGWTRDVDDAIDAIESLLAEGHAAAVIELCESAMRSLVIAIEQYPSD